MHSAVFSRGHSDQSGLAIEHTSGAVLAIQHGPNGSDERNLIGSAGGNYGWPEYTCDRNDDGTELSELPLAEGIVEPLVV